MRSGIIQGRVSRSVLNVIKMGKESAESCYLMQLGEQKD